MILHNRGQDLSLVFKIRVEDFDYMIFVSSDSTKCFGCGKEGHLIRACPVKDTNKTGESQEERQVEVEAQKEAVVEKQRKHAEVEVQEEEGEEQEDRWSWRYSRRKVRNRRTGGAGGTTGGR